MEISSTRYLSTVLLSIASFGSMYGADTGSEEALDLKEALTEGTVNFAARYRYEFVDQEGFDKDAHASTLRALLGYTTKSYYDTTGTLEFESTHYIGNQLFNNPVDSVPDRPVVADPEHVEVNQVYLANKSLDDTTGKLGRQRIILDDSRFVGNVGWRQNEQTFDSVRVMNASVDNLAIDVSYIWNANRIFSDEAAGATSGAGTTGNDIMNTILLNAGYKFEGIGKLVGFGYLMDYEYKDALDRNTIGARFSGSYKINDEFSAVYAASLAGQSDTGDNPNDDLSETYYLLEAGAKWKGITFKIGYEVLTGDGTDAFQTPLATLHKFQGWADKFLSTPANGVEDLYISLGGAIPNVDGLKAAIIYHDFTANETSDAYGSELDFVISYSVKQWDPKLVFGLKYAGYSADDDAAGTGQGTDVDKLWLWTQYAF